MRTSASSGPTSGLNDEGDFDLGHDHSSQGSSPPSKSGGHVKIDSEVSLGTTVKDYLPVT
ncbi:hypothetical protein [Microvirga yunnanensis]|uniref:hypothetical protein n=1 Tax=Microvirga yunnanensis TaxID=2953740 RepID=UPI0021C72624|nr:hypothetical protein [Microvirga sp. HBU67655]